MVGLLGIFGIHLQHAAATGAEDGTVEIERRDQVGDVPVERGVEGGEEGAGDGGAGGEGEGLRRGRRGRVLVGGAFFRGTLLGEGWYGKWEPYL